MNITDELVDHLCAMSRYPLPSSSVTQAKKCLLDYIGVTCAGGFFLNKRLAPFLEACPEGKASVLGSERTTDAASAALVNAFCAHVLEMDDGHRYGMIHLSAPIISAVLAVSQSVNVPLDRLLKGIVVGYEAAIRLAASIQPSHKLRGYHTAGTCGTIGAAAGAAVALDLGPSGFKAAISAAATSASGLLEIQEDGSDLKPYNVAHAAVSGCYAAMFAGLGFRSPDDILGGSRGFTKVLADGADGEVLLGQRMIPEIEGVYMKPFAACRHAHSAVEAMLKLRDKARLQPSDIQKVIVETYDLAVRGHDHRTIQGMQSAKLSIPYSVAAAYITGKCGIGTFFENYLTNEDVLALMNKVYVTENPDFTRMSPGKRIAEVKLIDCNGQIHSERVDYARGDPENPMSDQEIEAKFLEMMRYAHKEERAPALIRAVKTMERFDGDFYSLL